MVLEIQKQYVSPTSSLHNQPLISQAFFCFSTAFIKTNNWKWELCWFFVCLEELEYHVSF